MRSAPGFVTSNPPPAEWVERLQTLDPDLWIAWNPVGSPPGWCIMRWHGRGQGPAGAVLIDAHEAVDKFGCDLVSACTKGWSFVGPLNDRDGNPCGLTDEIIAAMIRNDWVRKYGKDKDEALAALTKEKDDLAAGRQKAFDDSMADAFRDTQRDHVLANGATSVIVSGSA